MCVFYRLSTNDKNLFLGPFLLGVFRIVKFCRWGDEVSLWHPFLGYRRRRRCDHFRLTCRIWRWEWSEITLGVRRRVEGTSDFSLFGLIPGSRLTVITQWVGQGVFLPKFPPEHLSEMKVLVCHNCSCWGGWVRHHNHFSIRIGTVDSTVIVSGSPLDL